MFDGLPPSAAWRHAGGRDGFEVVFISSVRQGWRFDGHTTVVEDGHPWTVRYTITVDRRWHTRRANVWAWSTAGARRRTVRGDGAGRWEVDGVRAPDLDGCLDVDLEASACTNTFPVHRIDTVPGRVVEAPAAYVRVDGLAVERLEQRYGCRAGNVYDYEAPAFDFACALHFDRTGLVLEYPGIASRVH